MTRRSESGAPGFPACIPDIGSPMPGPPGPFICELCRQELPKGARVCVHCGAHIHYGSTWRAVVGMIVVNLAFSAFVANTTIAETMPATTNFLLLVGWPAAFFAFRRLHRDRIYFSRPFLR